MGNEAVGFIFNFSWVDLDLMNEFLDGISVLGVGTGPAPKPNLFIVFSGKTFLLG